MRRGSWQTKLGIYFASIGSALGLGNFWRFPYIVAENGGGAFLFIFLAILFSVGLPILVFEFIFGRTTGQSITLGVKNTLKNKYLNWVGWLPVFISGLILIYYSVVAGWVLHFVSQFLRETLLFWLEPKIVNFAELSQNSAWQFGLASVHILIVSFILLKGVEQGLEKAVKYLTPLALVVISVVIMSLFNQPDFSSLWKYLFYPDFSKLNSQSLLMALGQVFFSTSLGMGVMVTYGSYLKEESHLPTIGFRIIVIDTIIAVAAAIMIFGVAICLGYDNLSEPGLLFVVIPSYFFEFPSGAVIGFAFFVVLYLVSILSSIGLLEVMISNVSDYFKWSRTKALIVSSCITLSGIFLFLVITFFIGSLKIKSVLAFDSFVVNFVLPCVVVGVTWLVQRKLPKVLLRKLFVNEEIVESVALYKEWRGALSWFIPMLLTIGGLIYFFK
jgi:NSS family neurotransmitter:Na+ symporter